MKIRAFLTFTLLLILLNDHSIGFNAVLTVEQSSPSELVIVIDSGIHADYGAKYPLTYQLDIPENASNLQVFSKYGATMEWRALPVKTSDDFFNGIEAARFDYTTAQAFVSASFGDVSDSLIIQVRDADLNPVAISYQGISKYYDNRQAAVTATADDWANWTDQKFVNTCRIFRDHQVWLSTAIITGQCSSEQWQNIQTQIDSGYVEAVAHSRTHPYTPYSSYYFEITICKQELQYYLDMPPLFRNGDREYVYVWVAPFGDYDDMVDSLVARNKFLVSRMYYNNFHDLVEWDEERGLFDVIGVSKEMGPELVMSAPWYATDDIDALNTTFDSVTAEGDVYHLMCHPNVLEWEKDYPWEHLGHISGHNDLWYAATGHLYLYHMIRSRSQQAVNIVYNEPVIPNKPVLYPNYPNPFNPVTTIRYTVGAYGNTPQRVELTIHNILGQKIATLVSQNQAPGEYTVQWDASGYAGGIYFYQLKTNTAGQETMALTRKMMLLK
jgi:hypothetical protein